jgi:hypothetical protein
MNQENGKSIVVYRFKPNTGSIPNNKVTDRPSSLSLTKAIPIARFFYLHDPNQVMLQLNSIPHPESLRTVKESLSE